jgi:exodeoxyribonuclease V alpha subunit
METDQQLLQGLLEKVVFKNVETGYGVFILKLNARETATITGTLCDVHEGERLELKGSWSFHKKFGRQFIVSSYQKTLPSSALGIQKYLASGLIKGIGPKYAEKMVERFGIETLEIIDKSPERLTEVEGIGPQRAEKITTAWQTQKEISRVMVFLQEKGVSTTFAAKMYKTYGNETIEKITQNPYRLVDDIWGVGFKTADGLAIKLGLLTDSLYRIKAGIIHAISMATNDGNVYALVDDVKAKAYELLELDENSYAPKIKSALCELFEQKKISLITHNNQHLLTLPSFYYSEKGIADKIAFLQKYPLLKKIDINIAYQKISTATPENQIILHEQQQHGIMEALQQKVSIITGGPGTGKTTLVTTLLALLDHFKINYRLAAPTGRAAKRMFEGTKRSTETIHRMLEFNPQVMQFTRNEKNSLEGDFFIIDEASMIDIFLMHSLLRAIPAHAHILFLGDIDQLPSVGAGNVLKNCIDSEKVSITRLTEIFRQAAGSSIIVNAHRINAGSFPSMKLEGCRPDFLLITQDAPEAFFPLVEETLLKKITAKGFTHDQIALLVPMNRGSVGTINLNHQMQQLINPAIENQPTITRFGVEYRLNDRVMQIRNNYDKFVFNGDIGQITLINIPDQEVSVTFGEREIIYDYSELNELVLAYALSIHKSQGSEFPVVIIPLFTQHFLLLQRNLLYTAVTRAQKLCILVGQTRAIAMAVKNNKIHQRLTLLKEYLTSELTAR